MSEQKDNVLKMPRGDYGTQFWVFHEGERVIHNNYRVPHLRFFRQDEGHGTLVLDGRFGIDGTEEEIKRWVGFVADAMAVAAGYSCFGEHSAKLNPFKPGKLVGITDMES